MELRKHPKMTWRGSPMWPPKWTGPYGPNKPLPQGEVGVLKAVKAAAATPVGTRCHLVMSYNDDDYLGTLLFEDEEFHDRICVVFTENIGSTISAIGSIEIS